jgi:RHS repeat-associated protein
MTSTRFRSFLMLSLPLSFLFSFPRAHAQSAPPTQITPSNDSGTNPYGSYDADGGNVNLSNGNLSLSLPLLTLSGRNGSGITFALQYDSKIWTPSAMYVNGTNVMFQWKSEQKRSWLGDIGWHLALPGVDPGHSDVDLFGNYLGIDGNTLTLPDGSKHYIVGRATTLDAQDGSGITGTNDANHKLISARVKDGTVLLGSNGHVIEDTNGNYISVTETNPTTTTYTDTLGRQIVATHISGGLGGYSSLSYRDSNGLTQTITFGYTSIPLFQTSGLYQTPQPPFTYPQPFSCPNCHRNIYVSQPSAGSQTLLTSVTLADGTQYTFSYNGYGELTKITYPTGGYTSYIYAPAVHLETFWSSTGFNIKGDFREVKERHVCRDATGTCGGGGTPEDITIFTPTISETQPNNAAMDVVDPLGYKNHYEFSQSDAVNHPDVSWPRETLHSVYSETGALLRTTQTTYYGMDTYCACPAYPKDVTTTLSDTGGTTLVTKTHYDYDTFQSTVMWPLYDPANLIDYTNQAPTNRTQPIDNPTQILEYNFGSGAVGTLARKTVNTWLKVNAANGNVDYSSKAVHIWSRKATTQTWDGGTTKFAETDFEYDNYSTDPLSSSGAVQHDTAYGTSNKTRGNLTAIKRWRNTDGAFLTTRFAYNDAGNATKTVDPLNHTTLMSYVDSWGNATCTPSGGNAAAFLTAVTNALGHVTRATYNSCTGSMASFTDPNNRVTSYNYDLMGRKTHAGFSDGGATDRTFYTASRPFSVTTSKKLDASRNVVSQLIVDGLTRATQTILCEDGATCTQKIKTDTTYDALGRKATLSNPYRTTSDSTYGLTNYKYDALGRSTLVIPPDGTQTTNNISTTYSGNCTTVTDQFSKSRKSCYDALERLTQVLEDPGTSPHLNYETDYAYDALDNLLCVGQKGTNPETFTTCAAIPVSWRPRRFTYDSLSHLLTATNQESGVIGYAYDADANLVTKVSPKPNQSGILAVTTSYTYDPLHRLIQKSFNDGTTPTLYFGYDTNPAWMNPPVTNPVGRLVLANNQYTGQSGQSAAAMVNSYDSMGRISRQWQQTPSASPSGYFTYYSYDLAGNLTSATNAAGTTITNAYDAADRLSTVTSSLSDAQHPASLYSVAASVGYYPNRSLRKATFGNALTETQALNNRLQPCRVEVNSTASYFSQCTDATPSGNMLEFTYAYNLGTANNGNIASWSSVGSQTFSRTYTYDSLNRIKTMSDTTASQACKGLSWTIDPWGNLTDQTQTLGTCYSLHTSVDGSNRLGSPYQYDAAGNMTYDTTHSYTYDAENHLSQVDAGATATYVYDANGQRIRKASGASWTEYFYDPSGNVTAEKNASSWPTQYVYAGTKLLALYQNSTTYFVHSDHLGSTRLLTKVDKSIYDNLDYLPFGLQTAGATGTTHKFTDKERDSESGLDNFGARYNSSSTGRFISPDWSASPSGVPYADFSDPQSLNLYAYAKNRPLTYIDRDGHCTEPITFTICVGLVVIGAEGIYNHFHVLHAKAASARAAKEFEQVCASSPQCDVNTVHQQTQSALREAGQAGAETALTTVPIVAPPNGLEELVQEAGAGLAKDAAVEANKPKEQQQNQQPQPGPSTGDRAQVPPPPPPPPPAPPPCALDKDKKC